MERRRPMLQTVQKIETKFRGIKEIIGADFSASHLHDSDFVARLKEAVEETYLLLNEGMCEQVAVCKECARNRDYLQTMIVELENLESGVAVTAAVEDRFMGFSLALDDLLSRVGSIVSELSES
jgi:hypothetical protein